MSVFFDKNVYKSFCDSVNSDLQV